MFEMHYYGRDGQQITQFEWALLLESDDGRRVARTEVVTPSGQHVLVSTVLIGLDMNYSSEGPPIIFETMTFDQTPSAQNEPNARWRDIEMRRYATEREALAGHAEIVGWLNDFGYRPVAEPRHQEVRSEE